MGRLNHKAPLNDFRAGGAFQASEFAATQVVPTAGNQHGCQGGRGVYVRAERGSLPPRASDMLAVRNRAIDGRGLSPPRSAALLAAPVNKSPAGRLFGTAEDPQKADRIAAER